MGTPLKTQRQLVERLIEHWMTGYGAEYNPTRKEALLITRVMNNFTEMVRDLTEQYEKKPVIVATSAKKFPESVGFQYLRKEIKKRSLFFCYLELAGDLRKVFLRKLTMF